MDNTVWWPGYCGNETIYDAFWSDSLTLQTSNPDLTDCFQNTVLLWIPCGSFWIMMMYWIPFLCQRERCNHWGQSSLLNLVKSACGVLLVGLAILDIGQVLGEAPDEPPDDVVAIAIRLVTMVGVTLITRIEFAKGVHSSGPLFSFWLLYSLCEIIPARSKVMRAQQDGISNTMSFATFFITYALILLELFCNLFSDHVALRGFVRTRLESSDDERAPLVNKTVEVETNPELSIPFWYRRTFFWMTPYIVRGYRKPVVFEDLCQLRPGERCKALVQKFYKYYSHAGQAVKQITGKTSVIRALFMAAGTTLIYGVIIQTIGLVWQLLQPQVLRVLLEYVEMDDPYSWKGIVLAAGLLVCSGMTSLCMNNFLYYAWISGLKLRTVANSIVYRKALRLSGASKKMSTVGEIVNLMAVDGQKIQDACTWGNLLWEVPIMTVATFVLMYGTIGPSALAGVVVIIILLPINGVFLANQVRKLQNKQMVNKDQRIRNMNEVLAGMKILKLYAWEPSFQESLIGTREKELDQVKQINVLNAVSNIAWFLCPYLVSLAVFATYVLSSPENVLTADKAFVTMSYINIFNVLLNILPFAVFYVGQAIVSLKRIQSFLELEELAESTVERDSTVEAKIKVDNASFSWETDGNPVLENIDFEVAKGQLVAVVGHVGSGKSSLIGSLLGESSKLKGRVVVNGPMAYVPQQAWIQNATLRDNVLFGKRYHQSKYNTIIESCAMEPDLKMLPGGDKIEIGEKGINLSGGQKQRVSLARAVYQDMDIYLLDDPLSAVDSHVGKHIFEKVIGAKGLLRNKTRILVTHSVTFLPHVDQIIVLDEGKVREMGTYRSLLEQNGAFADFLRNYLTEGAIDSDEDLHELQITLSALSGAEDLTESTRVRNRKHRAKDRKTSRSMSVTESMYRSTVLEKSGREKLIDEEVAEEGAVRWGVIRTFIKAGGWILFNAVVWFHLAFAAAQVFTNLWLSAWTNDVPVNGTMDVEQTHLRLGVYGAFGVAQAVTILVVLLAAAVGCAAASRSLHNNLLLKIMHAPMSFFDTTPLGRIMNRFSRDMDIIDSNIPMFLRGWLFNIAPLLATIIIITYTTPVFLALVVPMGIIYFIVQRAYITYVRQVKRIDNMRKSPVFSHFDESIVGASSIRAYGRQDDFIAKCDKLIDEGQMPYYHIILSQRWLGVIIEGVGSCVVFFTALFTTMNRGTLSSGLAGVAVTYALQVTTTLNSLIRCAAELETYMVSVERVEEYCTVPQEAEWKMPGVEPPPGWPLEGTVQFFNFSMRYRPGLDLVLKDFTCSIRHNEKIGIVGRTGAGKSSFALALFRILEAAEGTILIDGVRIAKLGLHDLRSKLTVIPQDPVIFSGSLRLNLDPFNQHTDEEIWKALDYGHLSEFVKSLKEGLEYECGEAGEALSVGQRQLVCLSRALLRKTKILVLDEATAAVDLETDSLIQNTIRTQFRDCTILTIAHRLNTVLDYDRIIVLDKGCIKEFDSPGILLGDTRSIFYSMAKEAGLI